MQNTIETVKESVEANTAEDRALVNNSQRLIEQYQQQFSAQNATCNYVLPISCLETLYVEQCKKMEKRNESLVTIRVAESNRFDVRNKRFVAELDVRKLTMLVQAYRDGKYKRVASLRKNQVHFERSWQRRVLKACASYLATCKECISDTLQGCRFALQQLSLYYN